jgi:hypothetical protein
VVKKYENMSKINKNDKNENDKNENQKMIKIRK